MLTYRFLVCMRSTIIHLLHLMFKNISFLQYKLLQRTFPPSVLALVSLKSAFQKAQSVLIGQLARVCSDWSGLRACAGNVISLTITSEYQLQRLPEML